MSILKPENVADYPRPPAIEAFEGVILVRFAGSVIAETRTSFRILETFHPPTYYLPITSFFARHAATRQGAVNAVRVEGPGKLFSMSSRAGGSPNGLPGPIARHCRPMPRSRITSPYMPSRWTKSCWLANG